LPPEQASLAELICKEVDRIRDVLAEVEPFSENASVATEQVNVHEVLRYVRDVARAGFAANVEFREEFDPSVPEIASSRAALVKLLLNVVKNASEAGADTITLITTTRQDYEVVGRAGNISPQLHLIIQDNGPGVPEAVRSSLFEPFISGKAEKGRGLGLAIAAKLADDLGGVLALEATERGCTRFRLTLRAV
jgi:two-component system nitrogen regulation sensor histidine kinase GlnL